MILIEKDKAINAIGEVHPLDYNARSTKARIEQLPTIEIVRCKDCKWWNFAPDNTMLPDWHGCRWYMERIHTRYEDFCSRGERRE